MIRKLYSLHATFINKPFPQLPTLLQLSTLLQRMANVAGAIAEAVEAMEAADAAEIHGDAPVIEDGDDEAPADPDQANADAAAVAAVPAVEAEGVLVPAAEVNAVNKSMRKQIADTVLAAVGSTPFHVRMDGMLLEQEEVQKHAVAVGHAPPIFRERYDTQSDFSWALFGFNGLLNSFYEHGVKNDKSVNAICAGARVSKCKFKFFLAKNGCWTG